MINAENRMVNYRPSQFKVKQIAGDYKMFPGTAFYRWYLSMSLFPLN